MSIASHLDFITQVQSIDFAHYATLCKEKRQERMETKFWEPLRYKLQNLAPILHKEFTVDFSADVITFECTTSLEEKEQKLINSVVEDLIPWRKGPFQIGETFIDSEWQSHLKWNRIVSSLPSLSGQKVLDVGCNNGYYMFRMMDQKPSFVLGIDTVPRFVYQFELLKRFAGTDTLQVEPLGVEDIGVFDGFFDTIFCMGVLYHRKDQFGTLELLGKALSEKGTLVLETLILDRDDEYCLCPYPRYAMMPNVWFIPSLPSLKSWLSTVGFRSVEVIDKTWVTPKEQRSTKYAPYKSLESFLSKEDQSKTVEGYPAPLRVALIATK